jgi:glycosyltransferase involved in cell wall biosynthesis
LARLFRLVREVKPDVLYANSFFARNTIRSLVLNRLGLLAPPIVVAPRGEAAPSALGLKRNRKRLYLWGGRHLRLFDEVVWQASSEREADDIRASFGGGAGVMVARNVLVAPDLVSGHDLMSESAARNKNRGEVRLVFISRISRMKNLAKALDWVGRLHGNVLFDIYGPIDEQEYWAECQAIAARCNPGVTIRYRGPLTPAEVGPTFANYHFSVLATLGENFGHVIYESLKAGTPVVLSDRTSWQLSKAGAGWSLSLEDEAGWVAVLQSCVEMSIDEYTALSSAASGLARRTAEQTVALSQNIALFEAAVARANDKAEGKTG